MTASQLKPTRLKLKKEQREICPLCDGPLGDDIVLDHDHATGDVRAVLCRWCNAVLGKVENWSNRIGRGVEPKTFLKNVLTYLAFHAENPSNIKYPTYKTEAEKRDARNRKARLARRKAKEAN
ncbi:endonuclease domain-containing protein [Burkholderia sp. BDU5]|uniref:endonuclease domain-containing protein n=1 Tax=Burkholderia sp. BDU5 TaxID=1385590 RepID=UPI0018D22A73|nr:endonuclease domain-containing protein [Burkholderia sp. BDU5]